MDAAAKPFCGAMLGELRQRGDRGISISVVLAALFGKAAVGAATKGIAAKAIAGKASVAGAKAMASHHGHGSLAHKVASELADEAKDKIVDAAAERAEDTLSKRGQKHGDA